MSSTQADVDDGQAIVESFKRDGFYFPLEVMSHDEALAYRAELGALEERILSEKLGNKGQLNFAHVVFPFADEIMRHPRILDAVETILGPDILAWGSTFFIKDAQSPSYVSWHQDLRYWGLDCEDQVSVWVALGQVTEAHGCMRFVPASHKGEMLEHRDTLRRRQLPDAWPGSRDRHQCRGHGCGRTAARPGIHASR